MKAFEEQLVQGKLQQAQEILDKNKQELEPSIYYFEKGRLHALTNEWPEARIAFLKSQKISPREETQNNLSTVEMKMVVSEIEQPRTINDYAIKSATLFANELALTANLLLLVLGLWIFKRTRSYKNLIMCVSLMIVLSSLSLWTKNWPWLVTEQEVDIYHGPSEIFEKTQVIPKGIKVLGVEKDSWIHIIYPSRLEGWIKKENISEL